MPYQIVSLVDGPIRKGQVSRVPFGHDLAAQRNWLVLGDDKALLWTSDPINDGRVVRIADDGRERLSLVARLALRNFAADGRDFLGTTDFRDGIASYLMNPVAGRGQNPLTPSKRRQQYEVWLGPDGLLWSQDQVVPPSTKTYVDDFSRIGALHGSTSSDGLFAWTDVFGSGIAVASGVMSVTASSAAVGAATTGTDTDNIYAQIVHSSWSGATGRYITIAVATDGTSGYLFLPQADGGRSLYRITGAVLLASDGATLSSPSTIRCERDGSTIRALVGGTQILAATDSSEPTGVGHRGAYFNADGVGTSSIFTFGAFGFGDIVAAPAGFTGPFPAGGNHSPVRARRGGYNGPMVDVREWF